MTKNLSEASHRIPVLGVSCALAGEGQILRQDPGWWEGIMCRTITGADQGFLTFLPFWIELDASLSSSGLRGLSRAIDLDHVCLSSMAAAIRRGFDPEPIFDHLAVFGLYEARYAMHSSSPSSEYAVWPGPGPHPGSV